MRKGTRWLGVALVGLGLTLVVSCCSRSGRDEVLVTGYCNCGECCSWTRDRKGRAVYAAGPRRGKPKKIGETASGRQTHPGTIAADCSVYPLGTRLYVPGYGYGVVEDTGGAVKGRHLDVWFPTHAAAKKWGRQRLRVKVVD